MRGMEISIIVPIYNVADYLDKCISSIMEQTYDKLQIILVDDGSTDQSSTICDKYKEKDLRITVIHKQNEGLVSARKAGLRAATGEYIGYVDADDWIEPHLYENMLNDLIRNHVDIVETEHFIDSGTKSDRIKSRLPYGRHEAKAIIPVMLCDKEFNECRLRPYLWSKLFKKSLLTKHQLCVDETICCGEDIAVTYPYMLDAESIYLSDYAGYHYVQRQDSMTGMQSSTGQEADRALIWHLKNNFGQSGKYSDIMLKQLNQYTKSMLLIRQLDFFDKASENKKLLPFGGIDYNERIAVYGAGRMGKSVYRYLKTLYKEKTILWGDKAYQLHRQVGLPIISPEEIVERQEEFDLLLIAMSSQEVSDAARNFLIQRGLKTSKAVWLTKEFISEHNNILKDYTCRESEMVKGRRGKGHDKRTAASIS
jgi:Glycosyltransferases involved in cell wall biogenesis